MNFATNNPHTHLWPEVTVLPFQNDSVYLVFSIISCFIQYRASKINTTFKKNISLWGFFVLQKQQCVCVCSGWFSIQMGISCLESAQFQVISLNRG